MPVGMRQRQGPDPLPADAVGGSPDCLQPWQEAASQVVAGSQGAGRSGLPTVPDHRPGGLVGGQAAAPASRLCPQTGPLPGSQP